MGEGPDLPRPKKANDEYEEPVIDNDDDVVEVAEDDDFDDDEPSINLADDVGDFTAREVNAARGLDTDFFDLPQQDDEQGETTGEQGGERVDEQEGQPPASDADAETVTAAVESGGGEDRPLTIADISQIVETLERTEQGDSNRQKLARVAPDLARMLGQLPVPADQPREIDTETLLKKIKEGDYQHMTPSELQVVMQLELEVPGFGERTGFKGTEEAFKLTNQFLNSAVIESHQILSQMELSMGPGNPLGVLKIENEDDGVPHHPDTVANMLTQGKLSMSDLQELSDSGKLQTNLIFIPEGIPGVEDMNRMSNSFEWLSANQDRIATTSRRLTANNQYHVLSEILGIDKPKWQPDRVADGDLEGYNNRMTEVLNLVFRVRNYAEAMKTLDNVDGDFQVDEAFRELRELCGGEDGFQVDDERKRVTRLNLDLPDELTATPDNERKLQDIRDWLEKYSGPVDQAMEDYLKGDFLRYMDLHTSGKIAVDSGGDMLYALDGQGKVESIVDEDGKFIHRGLDGRTYYDQDGEEVEESRVQELKKKHEAVSREEDFDYINQKFDATDDGEFVNIKNYKNYYEDHVLNYQHWFGTHKGEQTQNRQYRFDDYVAVQGQTGGMQLVRADRLNEFKTVQAFFHHGAKIASTALDVGMIVTGGMGAYAAVGARAGMSLAVNSGRILLGVGGFLDPMLRQKELGATGEFLREARHIAILFDVTQGLGRQGLGAISGGRLLFQSQKAMEVHKIIEASTAMRRTELATRWAFGMADAVWLPLMGSEAKHKIDRLRGEDSSAYLDRANFERGSGVGDSLDREFGEEGAGGRDPEADAKRVFDLYSSLIGDRGMSQIFADSLQALGNGNGQSAADKLVSRFHPSSQGLWNFRNNQYSGQWVPLRGVSAARARPGDVPVEQSSTERQRVATALSLLYLAQENGSLPEDGVLASREVKVPAATFLVKPGIPPIRIEQGASDPQLLATLQKAGTEFKEEDGDPLEQVNALTTALESGGELLNRLVFGYTVQQLPEETIKQQVTVGDVLDVLRTAALNGDDPSTQMVASDALFRSGALQTGRYAGVLLDVINNNESGTDLQVKALRQMSDMLMLQHVEESDTSISPEDRALRAGQNYGLSESDLKEHLQEVARNHDNPDIRAMAAAVLHAHELNLEQTNKDATSDATTGEDGQPAKPSENAIETFQRLWQTTMENGEPGAFHDAFVARMQTDMNADLPAYSHENPAQIQAYDQARLTKLRAATVLSHMEGGREGSTNTEAINRAVMDATMIPDDQWAIKREYNQRPDLQLTNRGFEMAMRRFDSLSPTQKEALRDHAVDVLDIDHIQIAPRSEQARQMSRANLSAVLAKSQVIHSLPTLFPGVSSVSGQDSRQLYQDQSQEVQASLREMLEIKVERDRETREIRHVGWSQFGMMRVAAIRGLENFGRGGTEAGHGEANLTAIAESLRYLPEAGSFRETDPFVRGRALQALYKLDSSIFRQGEEEYQQRGLPNLGVEHLLRHETDPMSVAILMSAANEMLEYDDPESFESQLEFANYAKQVSEMNLITQSENQLKAWLRAHPQFKFLDQDFLDNESERIADEYNSGVWGSIRDFFGYGKDATSERWGLERRRKQEFAEMTNFHNLSEYDQKMVVETLLHLTQNGRQTIVEQDEEINFAVGAAKMLAELADMEGANNDRVKDKAHLRAAIVQALELGGVSLPREARLHLVDAVNSMVDRDHGKDTSSGDASSDYTVFTPERAAAIFRDMLRQEAARESSVVNESEDRETRNERRRSEQLQLKLIGSIYNLRDMGSYEQLRERANLGADNRGSAFPAVGQRAREVYEELYWGTEWIKQDAEKNRGSLSGDQGRTSDADILARQLTERQDRNYQQLANDIFQTARYQKIESSTDDRVAVLVRALDHNIPRVQLAAARVLTESNLDFESPPMVKAMATLQAMALYGERSVYRSEASKALLWAKQREYAAEPPATVETMLNGLQWLDKAGTPKFDGNNEALAAEMRRQLAGGNAIYDPELTAMMLNRNDNRVRDFFRPDGSIVSIQSDTPGRAGLLRALEHQDERLRFAAAVVLNASSVESDRNRASEVYAEYRKAVDELATTNYEDAAKAILASRERPIRSADDPRREVLTDALEHPSDRVKLAAAWALTESSLPQDREAAIKSLATLATDSHNPVGSREAAGILTQIIERGNLDDQLLAYNSWYELAGEGRELIPKVATGYSRALNQIQQVDRQTLDGVLEYGSPADVRAIIKEATGWSDAELERALLYEYNRYIYPRSTEYNVQIRAEDAKVLYSRVNLCASHNPKHQEILRRQSTRHLTPPRVTSLSSQQKWSALLNMGSRMSYAHPWGGRRQRTADTIDSRMAQYYAGERRTGGHDPSDVWDFSRDRRSLDAILARSGPDASSTDAAAYMEDFFASRGARGFNFDAVHAADTLRKPERLDWQKPYEYDGTRLLHIMDKQPSHLSTEEARALYHGIGALRERSPEKLTGAPESDSVRIAEMLEQSHYDNYRALTEAIYSSVKDTPLSTGEDPRRETLSKALEHESERVRMAAAWVLSESSREDDFRAGVQAIAQTLVSGEDSQLAGEARALLEDMLFSGGDSHRNIVREAWQRAYDRGDGDASKAPPVISELDQARRYYRFLLDSNAESSLLARSVPERKAIILELSRASNPERPMTESELTTLTQPAPRFPILRLRSEPLSRLDLLAPGGRGRFGQVFPLQGFQSHGFQYNQPEPTNWSDGSYQNRYSAWLQPGSRIDTSRTGRHGGSRGDQAADQFARWLRQVDTGLDGTSLEVNGDNQVVLRLPSTDSRGLTVTAADSEKLTSFDQSAPTEQFTEFLSAMLRSHPEMLREGKVDAYQLVDMYLQSLRGRAIPAISTRFSDYQFNQQSEQMGYFALNQLASQTGETPDWGSLRRERDSTQDRLLNEQLVKLLSQEAPNPGALSARWRPPVRAEVSQPEFMDRPAVDQLGLRRLDALSVLPGDLLEMADSDGKISISALGRYLSMNLGGRGGADGDPVFVRVYPALNDGSRVTFIAPTDQRTLRVVKENDARRSLRVYQDLFDYINRSRSSRGSR